MIFDDLQTTINAFARFFGFVCAARRQCISNNILKLKVVSLDILNVINAFKINTNIDLNDIPLTLLKGCNFIELQILYIIFNRSSLEGFISAT